MGGSWPWERFRRPCFTASAVSSRRVFDEPPNNRVKCPGYIFNIYKTGSQASRANVSTRQRSLEFNRAEAKLQVGERDFSQTVTRYNEMPEIRNDLWQTEQTKGREFYEGAVAGYFSTIFFFFFFILNSARAREHVCDIILACGRDRPSRGKLADLIAQKVALRCEINRLYIHMSGGKGSIVKFCGVKRPRFRFRGNTFPKIFRRVLNSTSGKTNGRFKRTHGYRCWNSIDIWRCSVCCVIGFLFFFFVCVSSITPFFFVYAFVTFVNLSFGKVEDVN